MAVEERANPIPASPTRNPCPGCGGRGLIAVGKEAAKLAFGSDHYGTWCSGCGAKLSGPRADPVDAIHAAASRKIDQERRSRAWWDAVSLGAGRTEDQELVGHPATLGVLIPCSCGEQLRLWADRYHWFRCPCGVYYRWNGKELVVDSIDARDCTLSIEVQGSPDSQPEDPESEESDQDGHPDVAHSSQDPRADSHE